MHWQIALEKASEMGLERLRKGYLQLIQNYTENFSYPLYCSNLPYSLGQEEYRKWAFWMAEACDLEITYILGKK